MHMKECEKPLKANVIGALPKSKFKKQESFNDLPADQKACTVCMTEYEEGEELTTLTCIHRYHSECIEGWFKTQDFCPICRTKIELN